MTELEAANARLKATRERCSIQLRGRSLCLVATLPLKDAPGKKQQRITLGEIPIIEAERKAIELSNQIRSGVFSWDAWVSAAEEPHLITVDRFREIATQIHARKYRTDPERGAKTWTKNWLPALRKLPLAGAVTERTLLRVVEQLPENGSSRRNQGTILAQVAEHLHIPTKALRKACAGYGASQLTPRDIPEDALIEDLVLRTNLPHWRWALGMLATYGLRPHELEELTPGPGDIWIVAEHTKTGGREVHPCPSEWIDLFNLRIAHRPPPSKQEMSRRISKHLRDRQWPHTAYVLRHAYAIRLMQRGLPADLGALLMGHTLKIHTETYRRWLRADHVSRALARFDL